QPDISTWAAQTAWLQPRSMPRMKLTPTSLPRNLLAGWLPGSCRTSQPSTCNFVRQILKRPAERRKKDPAAELQEYKFRPLYLKPGHPPDHPKPRLGGAKLLSPTR